MSLPPPLLANDLRALGIPEPWAYGRPDNVRFYEIDALGHVNNAVYLCWFETIRVRWLEDYAPSGFAEATFVLKSLSCEYHAPMFVNEAYVTTARCVSFRNTSFLKEYAIWSAGELKCSGTALVVLTDAAGTQKTPLPDGWREAFAARDGAKDAR